MEALPVDSHHLVLQSHGALNKLHQLNRYMGRYYTPLVGKHNMDVWKVKSNHMCQTMSGSILRRSAAAREMLIHSGFTGVPLENFSSICTEALFKFHWSSTGEPEFHWSSWGCSWTWPSCATARGMSRSPNSWMRQGLEGELDRELLLVADPSQFKSTTLSDKSCCNF